MIRFRPRLGLVVGQQFVVHQSRCNGLIQIHVFAVLGGNIGCLELEFQSAESIDVSYFRVILNRHVTGGQSKKQMGFASSVGCISECYSVLVILGNDFLGHTCG